MENPLGVDRRGPGPLQVRGPISKQSSLFGVFQILRFVEPEAARDIHRIGLAAVRKELPIYYPPGRPSVDFGVADPDTLPETEFELAPVIPRSDHPICSFLSLTALSAVEMIGHNRRNRRARDHTRRVAFLTLNNR